MERSVSVRAVNILYLVSMLLVVVFGSLIQSVSFGWGLLATEVLLILGPTLFYLRLAGLPLRQTLRLNRISLGLGLAALMIGVGVWLVDAILSGVVTSLMGYSVSLGPGAIPSHALDALVITVSLCVAAPVCEEILFRGAILGAYQAVRPAKAAIIITSLLFAVFHLQLQGLAALLPIAFLVTYTAWRANSLYASMLVHFANNSMAALTLVVYALRPDVVLPFPSLPAAGIGVLILVAGVLLLNRLAPRPAVLSPAEEPAARRPSRIARYWPLAVAGVVFVAMAVVEITTFALPELSAKPGLALTAPAAWSQPAEYRYEIRNRAGQVVGEMNCKRQAAAEGFTLACQTHVDKYQVTVNGGTWMSDGADTNFTARWSSPDLKLAAMDGKMDFAAGRWFSWTIDSAGDGLKLEVKDNTGRILEQTLPAGAWINYEWPLRIMAADLQNTHANQVDLAWQNTYRPEKQDTGPVSRPGILVVRATEKLGQRTALRVTVDKFILWYATDEAHTLLKYDDGIEIYTLIE
jgi:membrane protease YdiL (CAAX protease family)